jgi:hypothetical protein
LAHFSTHAGPGCGEQFCEEFVIVVRHGSLLILAQKLVDGEVLLILEGLDDSGVRPGDQTFLMGRIPS